ncbi:hypothetical protein GCK72_020296 [Caenorhabditis remanei]|uniref:T20D4.11-like domain-containing protein n=1 Tax=Caenorhabditis remanei TaxID=31234 RepID=A0A6A5GH32_CAERE|nr:hypothetical protein GCK72_020296 [Caenorhabditis remanei]KAF1753739.1 hypothetical protein GCK72_020296 [Caenorhabditis remanei]
MFSMEYLYEENYEKLVDVMSTELNGNNCEGANRKNHQLKALECFAMQEITESRIKELTAFNTFFSSAPVENALKVCKDTQKDEIDRRDAYIYGKSCFMNYVKDKCNEFSLDYLSDNYQKFLSLIATKPVQGDCSFFNFKANRLASIECLALYKETESRVDKITFFNTFFSSTLVEDAFKVCKDAQKCFNQHSCTYSSDLRDHVRNLCDLVQKRI